MRQGSAARIARRSSSEQEREVKDEEDEEGYGKDMKARSALTSRSRGDVGGQHSHWDQATTVFILLGANRFRSLESLTYGKRRRIRSQVSLSPSAAPAR